VDAHLPRIATEDELGGFEGPVAVFSAEDDPFFPGEAVLARAREIFPNLVHAECLKGCRHVPSREVFGRVNEKIWAFLQGPYGP
jgi:hypothetical protein